MTQEVLKQMYRLLLTEPHAPTVCAQLERIAREALADHAMRETQRLGQEIEQEPVQFKCTVIDDVHPNGIPLEQWTPPPQRKPLTDDLYNELLFAVENKYTDETRHQTALRYIKQAEMPSARPAQAAHGIKE